MFSGYYDSTVWVYGWFRYICILFVFQWRATPLPPHPDRRKSNEKVPGDELKAAMQKADFVWLDKIAATSGGSGESDGDKPSEL